MGTVGDEAGNEVLADPKCQAGERAPFQDRGEQLLHENSQEDADALKQIMGS